MPGEAIALVATCFAIAAPAVADEAMPDTSDREVPPTRANDHQVEEVIVVGSYLGRDRDRVDGSLSIIDPERLAQSSSVAEALAGLPNVAVSRSGASGQLAEVRLRGAEANHTLVMLDGVVMNDPATGGALDFSQLTGTDVARIEVLRGAQSTRYGSDAIGGAINVLADEPDVGLDWRFGASGGSHRYRQSDAMVSAASDESFVQLFVDRRLTEGVSASRLDPERDGHEATSASIRAGLDRGSFSLRSTLRTIERTVENDAQDFAFPPTPTQGLVVDADERGASRVRMLSTSLRHDGALTQRASVSIVESRYSQFVAADRTGRISAERIRAGYEATKAWGGQQTVVAVGFDQTRFENESATFLDANFARTERQWSAALEHRFDAGRWSSSLGVRHDRNRRFRDATTYRLGGSFAIRKNLVVFSSYGSGITNPTFFERFGFLPASFVGNPSLEPEASRGVDLGIRLDYAAWRWDMALFSAALVDEIATVFDFSTFTSSPVNRPGRSKRRGIEIVVSRSTDQWLFEASGAFLDAREADDRVEVRRPRREANVSVRRRFDRASIYLDARASDGLRDVEFVQSTPADRAWLDDFVLVNVGASMRWRPGIEAHIAIKNIFDRDYEEVFGYAAAPRTLVAGIRITRAR